MPQVVVVIKYDAPDDPLWLNPDNVAWCLHAYCPLTKFEVEWAPGGNPWAAPQPAESTATPGNMPTTPCQHTFKVFATAVMCTRCRCVYDLSE